MPDAVVFIAEKKMVKIQKTTGLENSVKQDKEADIKKENEILKKENAELKSKLKLIEQSIRDEYLHSENWVKTALEKLVFFAAIELQPAELDVFNHKIIEFLGDDLFGYNYCGFFIFDNIENCWQVVSEKGKCSVDVTSMPEFKGSMVIEEDQEIYHFFDIGINSYLVHVSLVGTEKKFSQQDFSFMSLFIVLTTSFYSIKVLDREVQEKMIENSNMNNASRIIKGLKDNTMSLEDAFIDLIQNLNIESFVITRNTGEGKELNIVLSEGIETRSWDSFLTQIYETEEHIGEEWLILPVMDETMNTYGTAAFLLSHNLSIRSVQERIIETVVPQFAETLSNIRIQQESITDELTGAYNRRYVMRILEEKFKRSYSDKENRLSVAMIDIDNFKTVNDTYGHLAGDKVLKSVVDVFRKTLREVDVIGRYGGEEFLILIAAKNEVASKVCERIRSAIEKMKISWENREIWITVSIGFLSFNEKINNFEEMIALADLCLYEAKKSGKNKVVEYIER